AALLSASLVWAVSPTKARLFIPTNTNQFGGCGTFPYGPAVAPNGVSLPNTADNSDILSSSGPVIEVPVKNGNDAGHIPHWSVGTIPASCATGTIVLHRKYPSPSFTYDRNITGIPLNLLSAALSRSGLRMYRDDKNCTSSRLHSRVCAFFETAAIFCLAAARRWSSSPADFPIASASVFAP